METEAIATIARSAERLIICLFGGASLVMGWNLFKIGILDHQSADIGSKDLSFKLRKVGPGIFFALFGSAILVWSIASPLALYSTSGSAHNKSLLPSKDSAVVIAEDSTSNIPESKGMNYFVGGSGKAKLLAQSINSAILDIKLSLNQLDTSREVNKAHYKKMAVAINELETFKERITTQRFGIDQVLLYKKDFENYRINPVAYNAVDRKSLEQVYEWMDGQIQQ